MWKKKRQTRDSRHTLDTEWIVCLMLLTADVIRIRQILNINNNISFQYVLRIHNVVCCLFSVQCFLGMSMDRMVVVKWIPQDVQLAMIVIYFNFYILLVGFARNKYSEITIIAFDAKLTSKNHKMSYLFESFLLAAELSVYLRFWIRYNKNRLRQFVFIFYGMQTLHIFPNSQLDSLLNFSLWRHCVFYKWIIRINKVTNIIDYYYYNTYYEASMLGPIT